MREEITSRDELRSEFDKKLNVLYDKVASLVVSTGGGRRAIFQRGGEDFEQDEDAKKKSTTSKGDDDNSSYTSVDCAASTGTTAMMERGDGLEIVSNSQGGRGVHQEKTDEEVAQLRGLFEAQAGVLEAQAAEIQLLREATVRIVSMHDEPKEEFQSLRNDTLTLRGVLPISDTSEERDFLSFCQMTHSPS